MLINLLPTNVTVMFAYFDVQSINLPDSVKKPLLTESCNNDISAQSFILRFANDTVCLHIYISLNITDITYFHFGKHTLLLGLAVRNQRLRSG